MRTLLLLRHAKSDWTAGVVGDHDRPLSGRGREAAAIMGRLMAHAGLVPELCLTSTAVRAADTLARAARHGGWEDVPVEARPALYGAGPKEVIALLGRLPDDAGCVLLVGHEPGWSETIGVLTGGSSVRMATGTLARIEFQVERWAECRRGAGILTALIAPRLVKPPPGGTG